MPGDQGGRDDATADRQDDQQDHEDRRRSVATRRRTAPPTPSLGGAALEEAHHVSEHVGSRRSGLPGVVEMGRGIVRRDRHVTEPPAPPSDDQAVDPDHRTASQQGGDQDQVPQLEHDLALFGGQHLESDGAHGQQREVHPGEPHGRHDERRPDKKPRPALDDLDLGPVLPALPGIPPGDDEVEDQESHENQRVHDSLLEFG